MMTMRPSREILQQLVNAGLSDTEIADQYGVTRQSAFTWRKEARVERTTVAKLNEPYIPWTVAARHQSTWTIKRLRAYATRERGGVLPPNELRYLEELDRLLEEEGAVVDYDPLKEGGFFLRRRRRGEKGPVRMPV